MSESAVQRAFFEMVRLQKGKEWLMVMATPNQGFQKGAKWGAIRKAEGMSAGFPDISVLVPRGEYYGLFIELKYGKNKPNKAQRDWIKRLNEQGYKAVCIATTSPVALFNYVKKYLDDK